MKLKKWVEIILIIIALISLLFMGADFESIKTLILSKIIATSTFILASSVLLKYGHLN